jgi:hypothetical protein
LSVDPLFLAYFHFLAKKVGLLDHRAAFVCARILRQILKHRLGCTEAGDNVMASQTTTTTTTSYSFLVLGFPLLEINVQLRFP